MKKPVEMEIAYMIDLRKGNKLEIPPCKRIYFGHETCEKLLPVWDDCQALMDISFEQNLELTFITPFLTGRGFEKTTKFLEQLKAVKPMIEVVTSDWGLLNWVATQKSLIPVVGRFLIGQQLDFRLTRLGNADREERTIMIDGKFFRLLPKEQTKALKDHLSSCTLLKENTMDMFAQLSINRFEISNTFQPVQLVNKEGFHYSLHVPYVPLTIFRSCPGNLNFNERRSCNINRCLNNRSKWFNETYGSDIYCIDNALYYCNTCFQEHTKSNPGIDRVVFHETFN